VGEAAERHVDYLGLDQRFAKGDRVRVFSDEPLEGRAIALTFSVGEDENKDTTVRRTHSPSEFPPRCKTLMQ